MVKQDDLRWTKDFVDSMIKIYGKKQIRIWATAEMADEPTGNEIKRISKLISQSPFRLSRPVGR